jgi:hypothetical protein
VRLCVRALQPCLLGRPCACTQLASPAHHGASTACCALRCWRRWRAHQQVALQWMIQRDTGGLSGRHGPPALPALGQEGPAHTQG